MTVSEVSAAVTSTVVTARNFDCRIQNTVAVSGRVRGRGAWSSRHFLAFHFKVIIQTNEIKLISRNVEYFPSRFMADVISTGPKLLSLGFKIRHS